MNAAPLFSSVGEGFLGSSFMYGLVLLFLLYAWLPTAPAIATGIIGGIAIRHVAAELAAVVGFGIGFAVMCGNFILFVLVFRVDSFAHSKESFAAPTGVEIAAQAGGAAVGVVLTLAILWVWRAAERDY